jgi:hypothetical protein
MARQGLCRTGQVAKVLGLSAHQVRRLCETGMVEAELGPGGHWRIPVSEVVRLQKDGIPLIPSAVDNPERQNSEYKNKSVAMIKASPRRDWLALPSPTLIGSDEEIHFARNYLERPKVAKATESEADWSRERTRQQEENQAAGAQAFISRETPLQGPRAREQWHYRWLEWALESVRWGVPDEYRSEVRQEVDKTLQSLQPQTPESLTRKLVEGAIQKGLRTWRSVQNTEKALGNALSALPWSAGSLSQPSKWQIRAREEANSAISKLSDGASFEAKLAAATTAVQKITLEFEEQSLRQKIIDESILLPLLSSAEKEDVKAAIRISVESSRPGASEAELRRARWAALEPFEATLRQRENRQRLEQNVDWRLGHIRTFLNQLWNEGELEGFANGHDVWRYANEIREDVRAKLLEDLAGKQQISDRKIRDLIEDIVDDLLSG